jgi:hypothetical protein
MRILASQQWCSGGKFHHRDPPGANDQQLLTVDAEAGQHRLRATLDILSSRSVLGETWLKAPPHGPLVAD